MKRFVSLLLIIALVLVMAKIGKNETLVYNTNQNFIQGLAVSKDYIFVGTGNNDNTRKNEYRLNKLDRTTGEVVATSTETFNHTNDMTYNEKTNEVIVTGLHGDTGSKESLYDDDYHLLVADANTLKIKETINLKEMVLSVCSESIGISAVSYNANFDEYYVLTRYPERHIIILNNDFEMKSSVILGTGEIDGLLGGIYADDNYFYISNMTSYDDRLNDIMIYDRKGNLVDIKSVDGITHIEGIDYIDGQYYLSFTSHYQQISKTYFSKIYSMPLIEDIKYK